MGHPCRSLEDNSAESNVATLCLWPKNLSEAKLKGKKKPHIDLASSVNRVSREGVWTEKKKTIRQHCNMTPASVEVEVGLFFFPVSFFYTILGTCRE